MAFSRVYPERAGLLRAPFQPQFTASPTPDNPADTRGRPLPTSGQSAKWCPYAPVAQLDRALPSEGKGHTFESCRVRQSSLILSDFMKPDSCFIFLTLAGNARRTAGWFSSLGEIGRSSRANSFR